VWGNEVNKVVVYASAAVMLVIVVVFALNRFTSRKTYQAGEIYSVVDEDGFRVAKVLVTDTDAIHIRLYKNIFTTRPLKVDESKLTLGTIHDPDGFGMGHLPLSVDEFRSWRPEFVVKSTVRRDELEGYELWKESHGGVFEIPK
jgi:hypothetical protein